MMTSSLSRSDAQALSRRGGDGPKQQLPLRRGHFGRIRVSRQELLDYEATTKSLLADALRRSRDGVDLRGWKQLGAHAGFKRSTKFGDNGRDQHYQLQGTVRASLNDLMGILYADSTAQMVQRRETLYHDSLDAQTLGVLKARSAENMQEHLSLRWQAINLSNTSPIYQRDVCFLEYTGVTTDVDGFPVGFKVVHSVLRSECASLKASHGLARLDVTEIVLLRPTQDASHTDITLAGVVRDPENLPSWLVSSFLGNVASCLSKLAVVVQEKLLARLPMISDWQFVPFADRKSCSVCLSKFGMLAKKNHCRSCGDVACKSCVVTRTVGETTKFCKKCIIMVSNQQPDVAMPASEYGSHSIISGGGSSSGHSRSRRDSEISSSTTSSMLPGSNTNGALTTKMRVDMTLLDDGKSGHRNNCSVSSTASEGSFDSSSNSYCLADRRSSDAMRYGSLDEDSVQTVDTNEMVRALRAFPPSVSSKNGRVVPSVEAVEDSIAHQRHILKEMLSQAKTYQQQQQQQYTR
ncbi:hypothetical protein BBJ28_00009691 [Nothophytophthora sp. Chile5]|nr:hypothetical protein BBJ28_00009691 [Nothophytophthora sp. Chile5]